MTTDTKPRPTKAPARFSDTLQSVLDDYTTLPADEKHKTDRAIVAHLDTMPKDWVMAMQALIEALKRN